MGLLDFLDDPRMQEKIAAMLSRSLEQPTDTKAPLTQGLLGAGLGILANNRGNGWEAIGKGGLLGLQASNEERARQQKDPMQTIGLLNAAMGLQQSALTQQELKRVQGMMGGQQAPQFTPAAGLPADIQQLGRGMFDRGTGEGGELGTMGAPTASPKLSPAQVQSLVMSTVPSVSAMGEKLAKLYGYEPQNMRPGGSVVMPDAQGNLTAAYTAPNIGEGQQMLPGGAAGVVPGYLQNLAAIKAATSGGTKAGEVPYEPPSPVPTGRPGETQLLSRAGLLQLGERNAQQAQIPAGLAAAYADYVKSGGPAQGVAFRYTPPQGQLGTNPGPVAEKVAEQAALNPGAVEQTTLTDLAKGDAAKHDAAYVAANSASAGNDTLQQIRGNISKQPGLYSGMFAEGKLGVAGFFNGLGIPFDEARFSNTQETKKYMDELGLSLIKSFVGSTNISDQDRKAVMSIMPRITDSPKARDELLNTLQSINNKKIEQFQRMDAYIRENKTLRGFDFGFTKGATEKTPEVGNLPVNQTALYKAQQAIKAGADPAKVRERMIQQGYNPGGL